MIERTCNDRFVAPQPRSFCLTCTLTLLPSPQFRCYRFAVSTRWEREVAENGAVRDFHRFWCCCARRLGNMFVLCERVDGTPIVIAGPCWPFCMFVTLPLILAVSGAVAYFVIISDDSPLVSNCKPYCNWCLWIGYRSISTIEFCFLLGF